MWTKTLDLDVVLPYNKKHGCFLTEEYKIMIIFNQTAFILTRELFDFDVPFAWKHHRVYKTYKTIFSWQVIIWDARYCILINKGILNVSQGKNIVISATIVFNMLLTRIWVGSTADCLVVIITFRIPICIVWVAR